MPRKHKPLTYDPDGLHFAELFTLPKKALTAMCKAPINLPAPINQVRVSKLLDNDTWTATVQVYPSGRTYELVTRNMIDHHSTWFPSAHLGDAQTNPDKLKTYATLLLNSIIFSPYKP